MPIQNTTPDVVFFPWVELTLRPGRSSQAGFKETKSEETELVTKEGINIGISACVLGEKVRFDGGHKRDAYITETLSRHVRFVPMCPEVDIGLGTPRETLRLIKTDAGIRMVAPKSGSDHTDAMTAYAKGKAREIKALKLSGFILKKDSPSCGMARVRVYHSTGAPSKAGKGLFAKQLLEHHPDLPVEEDGRLRDPRLRENFFERVFAYNRLKNLFLARWKFSDLVHFHTREKFLLLAHDPVAYRELGRLVADGKALSRREVESSYKSSFMAALKKIATVKKHRSVLQHISGHFKKLLPGPHKAELHEHITDFSAGLIPLVVPVTLIRHFVNVYGLSYLKEQSYLDPHPKELMLRNHI